MHDITLTLDDADSVDATRIVLMEFVDVIGDTIDVLATQRDLLQDLFRRIDAGTAVGEVAASAGLAGHRQGLTAALDRLEAARREARLMTFRRLQATGCSIGEIARIFGISRQLVSRVLNGRT